MFVISLSEYLNTFFPKVFSEAWKAQVKSWIRKTLALYGYFLL